MMNMKKEYLSYFIQICLKELKIILRKVINVCLKQNPN